LVVVGSTLVLSISLADELGFALAGGLVILVILIVNFVLARHWST
jgi:hypothetical protein